MNRDMTCIICPNGCELSLQLDGNVVKSVNGASCKRGVEYATQEIANPKRTIASLVKVKNGEMPLASVRTSKAIPKDKIFEVMKEIKKIEVCAPIKVDEVIVHNVLGLGSDVIATKNIDKR